MASRRWFRPCDIAVLDVDVSATLGCLFVVSGESGEGAVSTVTRDDPLYAPVRAVAGHWKLE